MITKLMFSKQRFGVSLDHIKILDAEVLEMSILGPFLIIS